MDTQTSQGPATLSDDGQSATHLPSQSCSGSQSASTSFRELVTDWDKVERSDPISLVEAIARVQHQYTCDGMEPGAEHWQSDTRRQRAKMIEDVYQAWLVVLPEQLRRKAYIMPWHDDYVTDMWVAFRKKDKSERRQMWELLGLPWPSQLEAK